MAGYSEYTLMYNLSVYITVIGACMAILGNVF